MKRFKIGHITAPVGIRGEVRVFSYADSISRFSEIEEIYLGEGNDVHRIERSRKDKDMVVLKLSGIDDRNTSETLRGVNLYVDRDKYLLEEDSYFTDDLLDCEVFSDNGEDIGKLAEVLQYSAHDIYRIKRPDGKDILIPAVKEFIKSVDVDQKKITVHLIDGFLD